MIIGAVEIYTTVACPNCRVLKAMLEAAKIPFVERNIDDDEWRLKGYMIGRFTAPFVVVAGRLVENEALEKLIRERSNDEKSK